MLRLPSLALVAIACSTLGACRSVDDVPIERPVSVAAAAMRPPRDPIALPQRPLTITEVERYWAADRAALLEAGDVAEALRAAIARHRVSPISKD